MPKTSPLARSSLLLLLIGTACPSIQMQELQDTHLRKLSVSVHVEHLPQKAQQIRIWVPAPISVPGMALQSPLAVRCKGARFQEKSSADGNRYLFLEAPAGDAAISIAYEVTMACSTVPPPLADGSTSGLWESTETRVEGDQDLLTRIRKQALFVTAQQPGWLGKARALAAWLIRDFREGRRQGLALSFEKMRGDPVDMNRLYVTACGTLGIPATIEAGFALPKGKGSQTLDEVLIWSRIRIPGMDWIPVDLRDAQLRHDGWKSRFGGLAEPRIRLSSGVDAPLEPPMQDGIPRLFLRPHAECDGKVWNGMEIQMVLQRVPSDEG